MPHTEISNTEQLRDILFQLNEISSVIASNYFRKHNIPADEMQLLSSVKLRLSSATLMIEHIIDADKDNED